MTLYVIYQKTSRGWVPYGTGTRGDAYKLAFHGSPVRIEKIGEK